MQQGLGGMPAPAMEQAQFAGGGIVAFQSGGLTAEEESEYEKLENLMAEGTAIGRGGMSPYGGVSPASVRLSGTPVGGLQSLYEKRFKELRAKKQAAAQAEVQAERQAGIDAEARRRGISLPKPVVTQTAVPTKPPVVERAAPPRTDTTSRVGTDSRVPAAPRVAAAAPAAPKMPSAADFEQQLQERNKPFAEATERFRTYLQGEEATSKEEAKRDRMLTLAQAGFAMAEAASKPGATFLGSAGAAGGSYAKNMMQLNREAAVAKRNMQKELLALDQAKAANDVNMYNASLSSFMKDREFVTQVNQFNQGFSLQQAKLELDRVLGTGQIAASMANAAATLGYREDESAARRDAERNEMAVKMLELVDKRKAELRFDRAFNALSPEEQQKTLDALPAQAAREVAALSGGGGGASSLGIQYLGSRPSGQ
jgi:hypothetical protein